MHKPLKTAGRGIKFSEQQDSLEMREETDSNTLFLVRKK